MNNQTSCSGFVSRLQYVRGDVTRPQAAGPVIVAHVCNDAGGVVECPEPSPTVGPPRGDDTVPGFMSGPISDLAASRLFGSARVPGWPICSLNTATVHRRARAR